MVKILVLFYSTYGHIFQLAQEMAKGAQEIADVQVDLHRVQETLPTEVLAKMHAVDAQKAFAHIPIADPHNFGNYDGYILGFPTRFGQPPAQMKSFIDALGGIWMSGACIGKPASCFTSSNTQHGGQESTILAMHPTLLHLGLVVVVLPYSAKEQMGIEEIRGGSPYGLSTIAGNTGERLPSEAEKSMARFQGRHTAQIAKKLAAGDAVSGGEGSATGGATAEAKVVADKPEGEKGEKAEKGEKGGKGEKGKKGEKGASSPSVSSPGGEEGKKKKKAEKEKKPKKEKKKGEK